MSSYAKITSKLREKYKIGNKAPKDMTPIKAQNGRSVQTVSSVDNKTGIQESTKSSYHSVVDGLRKKYSIVPKTQSAADWSKSAIDLIEDMQNHYGTWSEDNPQLFANYAHQAATIRSSADKYKSQYAGNSEITNYIDMVNAALDNTVNNANTARKKWSDITGEEYAFFVKDSQWRQKYADKGYSEILEVVDNLENGEERAWLSSYAPTIMTVEDYDSEIATLDESLEMVMADLERYKNAVKNLRHGAVLEMIVAEINDKYGGHTALEEHIEGLKAKKWNLENGKVYNFLSQNEDFEEQSRVTATEMISNPLMISNMVRRLFPDSSYHYDVVNGFIDVTSKYKKEGNVVAASVMDISTENLTYLTPEEKKIYNYLYNTQGDESAEEYLKYLKNTLSSRAQAYTAEEWSKLATQFPVQSNIVSVPLNLWSGAGYMDVLGQKVVKDIQEAVTGEYAGPIDYNSAAMLPATATSAIRGTTAQNLVDKYGVINFDQEEYPILSTLLNGKNWGDVYQLGMSMVDSTAVAVTSPVLGTAGTLMLSGSAATQSMLNAVANGATDEQALWMGALSGAFEYLFEKYELESLLKNGSESAIRAFVTQSMSEGFGEGATTIANMVADSLIMADKSELNRLIAGYMATNPNMSVEEATKKARIDMAVQAGWDTVGGVASGSIMGGGSAATYNAWEKFVHTNVVDTKNQTDYDNITEQGGAIHAETQKQGESLYSGGVQRNTQSDSLGETTGSPENGRGNVRSGNQGWIHGGNGKGVVHTKDSEGRTLSSEQVAKLQGTAVTDSKGAPLAVYHATDNMEFTTFEKGDTGFHFGSAEQAAEHSKKRGYTSGRTFRAYLNIKNPIQMGQDIMGWHPGGTALRLWGDGILSESEVQEITALYRKGDGYDSAAAVRLRELLESKGYDGIAYPNGFEGDGTSYIAFQDAQIIKTDITKFAQNKQQTTQQVLQQAIADMDNRPMDPKSYNALDSYKRQLQHTETTRKLLNQKQDILRQQQADSATAENIPQTKADIAKLTQMLKAQEGKLKTLEQNPALQRVIDKTRTGMQNVRAVENSRENALDISRTYDRINKEDIDSKRQLDTETTDAESGRGEVEKIKCRNERLVGQKHPVTGVPFVRKQAEVDGKQIEVVVPEFESYYEAQLPEEMYMVSDKRQFKECNRQLKNEIARNPELRAQFSEKQLAQIAQLQTPVGYSWHHDAEAGTVQLVDKTIHEKTGHTGGRGFWGGGTGRR